MILPTDRANTQVGKWLIFISLLLFSITLTHHVLGTDGSFYFQMGTLLLVSGISFRIARYLEESDMHQQNGRDFQWCAKSGTGF